MRSRSPIKKLLEIMATLRSPSGCPWDREQNHQSLRFHAIEEVYELLDAIEANDDHEMAEELGDLLLQVVFHCQLAQERGAFDFEAVCQKINDKLIRRHPHVFGNSKCENVDAVWAQWEKIKRAEKSGTKHDRPSSLDGIPKHLPTLMRAEKLIKKARKAGLEIACDSSKSPKSGLARKTQIAQQLFDLAMEAQGFGWSAESLLRDEVKKREGLWRKQEQAHQNASVSSSESELKPQTKRLKPSVIHARRS